MRRLGRFEGARNVEAELQVFAREHGIALPAELQPAPVKQRALALVVLAAIAGPVPARVQRPELEPGGVEIPRRPRRRPPPSPRGAGVANSADLVQTRRE